MSTKDLSHTIIEGGRYRGNKYDRRQSHADVRAKLKNYLVDVMQDLETAYEEEVEPGPVVHQGFRDKLGPIYRWLRSQIGRPWDDVRSDVAEKFDTRTVAGRHIVFDHLLKSVSVEPDVHRRYYYGPEDPTTSYYRNNFYVDEAGVLQEKQVIPRPNSEKIPNFDTKKLANWLNGRIVGKVGNKYYWFTPTGKAKKHRYGGHAHIWKTVWGRPYDYYASYRNAYRIGFEYLSYEVIYKVDSLGFRVIGDDGAPIEIERKPVWKNASTPTLRQDRKLNEKEMVFWNSIPEYYQTKVLEESPTYSPEKLKARYGRSIYGY